MAKFTSPLDRVRIAAPCPADWNQMYGDDRVRFCSQCNLNVYNLSGMRKEEAEALLASTEGRLCVRFYRRADGTVLTANCPTGLQAIKRRVARAASAAFWFAMSVASGLGFWGVNVVRRTQDPARLLLPERHTMGAIDWKPRPEARSGLGVKGQPELYVGAVIHREEVIKGVPRQLTPQEWITQGAADRLRQ